MNYLLTTSRLFKTEYLFFLAVGNRPENGPSKLFNNCIGTAVNDRGILKCFGQLRPIRDYNLLGNSEPNK